LAALVLTLVSCAQQTIQTTTTPDTKTAPAAYVIGRDDVLNIIVWKQNIIVWKQPQLSGNVRVAGDGTVTVPLVGPVPVEGLTCDQLQADLVKRLTPYTQNPNVTVRIASANSQVFYVLGEVTKPGSYPLRSGEVLSQGLAQAGGFTVFADKSSIKIARRMHDQDIQMTVNYRHIEKGELKADIPLEAGDTITVP
jgi:polysaccharide export outer membrane protein